MATLGATAVTLSNVIQAQDPDGKVARMIPYLKKFNAIIGDMLWKEGNLQTGHQTTIETGYPDSTWRQFNAGTQPSKGTQAQVTDTCGMLSQVGEVDKDLAELNGNSPAFLMQKNKKHLYAMGNDLATALFYANQATDPTKITGLAPRYNSFSTDPDLIGYNVLNGGGTESANTSIFMVGWGDDSIAGIYPKGSKGGLEVRNKGIETKTLSDGSMLEVYRTFYSQKPGLSVMNWKQGVRICNIDVGDLTTDASTGAKLLELMTTGYYRLQDRGAAVSIYCNTTILEYLHHQALNKASNVRVEEVDGEPVVMWLGKPVKECQAILNTESKVV